MHIFTLHYWRERAIRFAISILRDRVRSSLRRIGYTESKPGYLSIIREDTSAIGGSKIEASIQESTAITELFNVAIRRIYS